MFPAGSFYNLSHRVKYLTWLRSKYLIMINGPNLGTLRFHIYSLPKPPPPPKIWEASMPWSRKARWTQVFVISSLTPTPLFPDIPPRCLLLEESLKKQKAKMLLPLFLQFHLRKGVKNKSKVEFGPKLTQIFVLILWRFVFCAFPE